MDIFNDKVRTFNEVKTRCIIDIVIALFSFTIIISDVFFGSYIYHSNFVVFLFIIVFGCVSFAFSVFFYSGNFFQDDEEMIEDLIERINGLHSIEQAFCRYMKVRDFLTMGEYCAFGDAIKREESQQRSDALKNKIHTMCEKTSI